MKLKHCNLRLFPHSNSKLYRHIKIHRGLTAWPDIAGGIISETRICPESSIKNCALGYKSIGDPFSSLSSCCFNSASCSCCDWSIRCIASVWNINAIALTRQYGLFRLSMASAINSSASRGVASTSLAVAPASLSRTISFRVSRTTLCFRYSLGQETSLHANRIDNVHKDICFFLYRREDLVTKSSELECLDLHMNSSSQIMKS